MTSTQKTYSTNPKTVKIREYFEANPEIKQKVLAQKREYIKNKRADPAYREAERPKWREYAKNKYDNNPEEREKKKAAALARYYRLKAEKAAATLE